MPVINIKTIKGALNSSQKKIIHERLADLMVEVEGKGNKEFRKYVITTITEEDPVNFSIAGQHATDNLLNKIT